MGHFQHEDVTRMSTAIPSLLTVLATAIFAVQGAGLYQEGFRGDPKHYEVSGHNSKVVCYWGTWSNYRPGNGKFTPESIDPKLCTHLIYSFAGLDSNTWEIKPLDPWMDLSENYGLAGYEKTTALKYANPKLKVTIAIGGWNQGSLPYSDMAKDPEKRKLFVKSVLAFIKKYNFDGLDLDWEYPAKRGGIPEDKENFILLIKELKEAFVPQNLLLTAAIGAALPTMDMSYDIPKMYKYLDFVHVMCYDYHGKWDLKTGHNSPLYSDPSAVGQDVFLNVDSTINHLMQNGGVPEKTILGVPLYGRTFMLANPHDHRMGARAADKSFAGPYTKEDGFLGYNEICEELTKQDSPWTVELDESSAAPYMYQGLKWASYDDVKSIKAKAVYSYSRGLGGIMVWSMDTDDFKGNCGGPAYPLLRTINNALYLAESHQIEGVVRGGGAGAGPNAIPGSSSPSVATGAGPSIHGLPSSAVIIIALVLAFYFRF